MRPSDYPGYETAIYFVILTIALISRVALLELPPIYDELYQFLPSVNWANIETLSILDGIYSRAANFSRLIALSFDISGRQDLWTARFFPSVLPGALLVLVVFAWTRAIIGKPASLIVAGLMVFWPLGIEVSQYIRFYALQGFVFFCAAALAYYITDRTQSLWRLSICIVLMISLFLFSLQLQTLSLVGGAAVVLWLVIDKYSFFVNLNWKILILGLICAVATGIALLLSLGDYINDLWVGFRWQAWPGPIDYTFYHRVFRVSYPTLWTLFPIALGVALLKNPRPALLCILVFGISLVVQSLGGLKAQRYVYSTMPFFFVIWAICLQAAIPSLRHLMGQLRAHLDSKVGGLFGRFTIIAFTVGCLSFVVGSNPAFVNSISLITGTKKEKLLGKKRWDWHNATELSAPWIKDGAFVVTTEELYATYWLGDFDLGFNQARYRELALLLPGEPEPFVADPRTGRPMIGQFPDLKKVMECEPVGIILAVPSWLGVSRLLELQKMADDLEVELIIESEDELVLIGWRAPRSQPASDCRPI